MLTVKTIYETIDQFAPFASQESWDNSGLLVGSMDMPAERILTTLDISASVIETAIAQHVQLIVSHHPVIFSPLKSVPIQNPVYQLAANGIAAICVHTPLDIAPDGLNGFAHRLLENSLELKGTPTVLEPTWIDGRGFGWVDSSRKSWEPKSLAEKLEGCLNCESVRYSQKTPKKRIQKIAYCSGAGGSMLELAAEKGCDALITGDIKHDRWYAAAFLGITLFDCGHYGTEQMAAEILRDRLQTAHPDATIQCMTGGSPFTHLVGGATK